MAVQSRASVSDRVFIVVLAYLIFCQAGAAGEGSGLPPLIEREHFLADPDIAAPQLSPDGKLMSFIRPYEGTRTFSNRQQASPDLQPH